MAKPGSNPTKFTIGNKSTLEKPGVRDALIKFWKEHYSANVMHVILLGKDTCYEILEKSEPILLRVENRNYQPPVYRHLDHPYGPEQKKKFMQLKTIKDENLLKFMFFLP